jgi:hypothetical protein
MLCRSARLRQRRSRQPRWPRVRRGLRYRRPCSGDRGRGRQGIEPHKRAMPGCRRAPNTRKAPATPPLRHGGTAPGGGGDPWQARTQWGQNPGGPAPGLVYRPQARAANPRGTSVRHGGRESDRSRVPRTRPNTVEGQTTRRRRAQAEAAEGPATCARPDTAGSAAGPREAVACALAPCLRDHPPPRGGCRAQSRGGSGR